jgi:hypothetical protein
VCSRCPGGRRFQARDDDRAAAVLRQGVLRSEGALPLDQPAFARMLSVRARRGG